jgi:hypothetical protein
MTLNNLKKEVLALTFETELDSHESFAFAVNRALLEIHSERDRREALKIYKQKLAAECFFEKLTHKGGAEESVTVNGKAFSLTAVGTGKILFTDGKITESINFTGTGTIIKRKVNTGSAFLKFSGEFDYTIHNLASFAFLNSADESEIPLFDEYEKIDMTKKDPLFLSFTSEPKSNDGKIIPGLKIEGSSIFVPRQYEGEININYKRLPRKVKENELDCEIDIAPECAHLLALRVSAYLLFDGNEGLSEYYLSLYKSGMSTLKFYTRKATSEGYYDVLGWA